MAYLVNLALNLGIPYMRANAAGKEELSMKIFFKGGGWPAADGHRFGYINNLDLTGWGTTNNPFFQGIEADMIADTKFLNRTSFKNHKWVCLKTLDSNGSMVYNALDACAGPAATVRPVSEYLSQTIDVPACEERMKINPGLAHSEQQDYWPEDAKEWSVSIYNTIDPVAGMKSQVDINDSRPLMVYDITPFYNSCRKGFPPSGEIARNLDTGMSVGGLCEAVTAAVQQLHPDVTQPTFGTTGSAEHNRTSLYYAITTPGNLGATVPLLKMQINVLQDFGATSDDLAAHLDKLDRPVSEAFSASVPDHGDFSIMSNTGQEAILVYRNIWLDITTRSDCKLADIVQALDGYMASYTTTKRPPNLLLDQINIVFSSSVKMGTALDNGGHQYATAEMNAGTDFAITVTVSAGGEKKHPSLLRGSTGAC